MKIKGNTVGTTMPRANLNQTDPKKADYVHGREILESVVRHSPQELTEEQKAQARKNIGLVDDGNDIVIDEALSLDSENPVQNKVITAAINSAMLKGTDPVPSLADDTPDFWRNLGAGAWEISYVGNQNIVDGGTFYFGTLLNMPASNSVYQVVFAPMMGNVYYRTAGSGNSWSNTWKLLIPTKQELVQGVLDALPTWEGGAY